MPAPHGVLWWFVALLLHGLRCAFSQLKTVGRVCRLGLCTVTPFRFLGTLMARQPSQGPRAVSRRQLFPSVRNVMPHHERSFVSDTGCQVGPDPSPDSRQLFKRRARPFTSGIAPLPLSSVQPTWKPGTSPHRRNLHRAHQRPRTWSWPSQCGLSRGRTTYPPFHFVLFLINSCP
jgi:hypothetical protein